MDYPRGSEEFKQALNAFLDDYFSKDAIGGQILCPCKKCSRRYCHSKDDIYDHLIVDGFVKGFKEWVLQREASSSTCNNDNQSINDDQGVSNGPNDEAKKFYRLVEEGKQELYEGCKTFSKLSFMIRLFLFKCLNGVSNAAFDDLLELLREAFPMARLPKSYYESKKIVSDLGLDYKKIHACPNDCVLFWKDLEGVDACPKCETSRWKSDKVPAKVLRHFPLKPRLQRLFMCPKTAQQMIWHHGRKKDEKIIRHPADAQSWKDLDKAYPNFASDPRNVRLALASDGFNPFRTMSVAHSTWPVMLINYNLPPWLSMKPEYFMLSLLIPGPKSPRNNIHVYLQPLIEELKELWGHGVETYDAFKEQSFQLRAALMGTINDFPAYSMLSGWCTKGNYACPNCNHDVEPHYLSDSRKNCYMETRRFLDKDHPWRKDKKSFNGTVENRAAPTPLSGQQVLAEVENIENDFAKKKREEEVRKGLGNTSLFFLN